MLVQFIILLVPASYLAIGILLKPRFKTKASQISGKKPLQMVEQQPAGHFKTRTWRSTSTYAKLFWITVEDLKIVNKQTVPEDLNKYFQFSIFKGT